MSAAVLMALPEILNTVANMRSKRDALPQEERVLRHQLATFVLEVLIGVGFYAAYSSKHGEGHAHFTSQHGILGGLCGVCVVAEVCLGVTLRFVLDAKSPSRPLVKQLHGLFSVLITVTSMLCFLGGMMFTEYAQANVPWIVRQLTMLGALSAVVGAYMP
ncbi:ferric reductase transmembrane protein-like protein [Strigomonas culicis]|uniref:Ferric reductase transmembrane protein-like protein n=1 Tax=Strigomonas culicis TaxID=28005 RepID=S9USW0_9TRYP|nr:ferric reductase transmembrane protein-like protein [Strigomonas culicis]|eukprot:EPY31904.1 ferric reductase transmembrane protein-like protein [Strigomonas culicis]